jgi:hypothetical protein
MIWKLHKLLILAVIAMALLCWTEDLLWHDPVSCGPQTMDEVIAIVREIGLHRRGDIKDGTIGQRLVVSQSPLTWECASRLSMGFPPESTKWMGTVAVYRRQFVTCTEVFPLVPWGRFYLYGDRSLIDRLTRYTEVDL